MNDSILVLTVRKIHVTEVTLRTIISYLLDGCAHEHAAFPHRGWQRCLDCGRQRRYTIGRKPANWQTDGEVAQAKRDRAVVYIMERAA